MRTRVMFMALAAVSVIAACTEDDDDITFSASLNGAGERPAAVTTSGTGTFTGSLDEETNILTYTLTWSGLGSASNNAHIHGPITVGSTAAAGVLIDFNVPGAGRTITHGASGSASGSINFNTIVPTATVSADSLKKLFNNGAIYINIHSVNFPGGEIAGIVTRQ